MLRLTTIRWVPKFAHGFVRDLRVRWACEEAGIPYELRLIGSDDQNSESYRREQPFGQIPVLQDGDLTLFESGAIVLHIGEKSEALLPKNPIARARTISWVFASLNTIEPAMVNFLDAHLTTEPWGALRRPTALADFKKRLTALNQWLEKREYLEETFTIGDLLMSTVLRDLMETDILKEFPNVDRYHKRCEARPAFQTALAAQIKTFTDNEPKA